MWGTVPHLSSSNTENGVWLLGCHYSVLPASCWKIKCTDGTSAITVTDTNNDEGCKGEGDLGGKCMNMKWKWREVLEEFMLSCFHCFQWSGASVPIRGLTQPPVVQNCWKPSAHLSFITSDAGAWRFYYVCWPNSPRSIAGHYTSREGFGVPCEEAMRRSVVVWPALSTSVLSSMAKIENPTHNRKHYPL